MNGVLLGKARNTPTTTPRGLRCQPHMCGLSDPWLAGAADRGNRCLWRSLGAVVGIFCTSPGGTQAANVVEGKGRHWIQPTGWSFEPPGLNKPAGES